MLELTNHVHRYCGGRILVDRDPDTFTTGGNPFYRCADCEAGAAEMTGHAALCMCGDDRLDSHCVHRDFAETIPGLKGYVQGALRERGEVLVVRRGIWNETVGAQELPAAPPRRPVKNPSASNLGPVELARLDATERQRYPKTWGSPEIRAYHAEFRKLEHEHALAAARRRDYLEWPATIGRATIRLWKIVDHVCRYCDARMLVCVKNNGMSPGGNPTYMCSGCGRANWSMSGHELCYCGWRLHHQDGRGSGMALVCRAYTEILANPHWAAAARMLGQCPDNPEGKRKIGVIPYQVARYIEQKEATP